MRQMVFLTSRPLLQSGSKTEKDSTVHQTLASKTYKENVRRRFERAQTSASTRLFSDTRRCIHSHFICLDIFTMESLYIYTGYVSSLLNFPVMRCVALFSADVWEWQNSISQREHVAKEDFLGAFQWLRLAEEVYWFFHDPILMELHVHLHVHRHGRFFTQNRNNNNNIQQSI